MIEALIAGLRAERIEFTAEEIADICWLCATMPSSKPPPGRDEKRPEPAADTTPPKTEEPAPSVEPPAPEKRHEEDPSIPAPPQAARQPEQQHAGKGELLPAFRAGADETGHGVPFRVPAAVALPGALDLTRALRPLMKRIPSRTRRQLDESATVDRIAEQHIWMPVMRSMPERWLEVALIVEETFEMRPWARTIREFQRLLGHSGAFRDVRPWRLVADGAGFRLLNGMGTAAREPGELIDAAGARVILIASDCSSALWRDAVFMKTLKDWGMRQPVAVVQMLPQRLWTSTVLRDTSAVRVRSLRPGSPNAKLTRETAIRRHSARPVGGTALPIVTLEKPSVSAWAATVAGTAGASVHAGVFPPFASTPSAERTVEEAWNRFSENASPVAQDLARLLAAAPLTLPIMRLVQRTMLPESRQVHLAEVFRSGLIFPVDDSTDAESVRYEFKEDIRARLLDDARASDSVDVLRAALSDFVDARTGQPLDFLAVLRDPDALGGLPLNAETKPFADVAAQVLSRMGSRYQALAERLAKGWKAQPPVSKPDLIFHGYSGPVSVLAIGPGGLLFAAGVSDTTFALRDVRTGLIQSSFAHDSFILSAAFSHDGKKLALAYITGCSLVDLAGQVSVYRTPLSMLATSLVFSYDNETLIGITSTEILVCDPNLPHVLRRFPRTRRPLAVCNPAGYAVAESDGTSIWIRDLKTGSYVTFGGRGEPLYRGEKGWVVALAYSSSGHFLAACFPDTIAIWDAGNGQQLSVFALPADIPAVIAVSADGRLLASVSAVGLMRIQETVFGRVLRTLASGGILSIAFSPTENRLAAGTRDGTVAVWDLSNTGVYPVLTGRAATPRVVRILAGRLLAVRNAVAEGLRNAGHTVLTKTTSVPDAIVGIGSELGWTAISDAIDPRERDVEFIALTVGPPLPGAIDFHDPAHWQAGFDQLLRKLDELKIPGPLVGVPELPPLYVRRREAFQNLEEWAGSDIFIAAILGSPGSGKQSLAIDFARDPAMQRTFPGGIYWAPDSPPAASAPTLVIDPRYELESANRANTWFITIDRNGLRSTVGQLTCRIVRLQPLTVAEQDEIAAPARIPEALRTPALSTLSLLALWKRILLEFQEEPVLSWLSGKEAPAEYGADAERFAMQCAIDLMPEAVRETLRVIGAYEKPAFARDVHLPDEFLVHLTGSAESVAPARRYARALDLLESGDGRRPLRAAASQVLYAQGEPKDRFRVLADYYLQRRKAAGDAGWSGVPDDAFFPENIAWALSGANETGELRNLLRDAKWIARRLAAGGVEALLGDARLAGFGEEFERIFRAGNAPKTPEEIEKRLAESGVMEDRHQAQFTAFVSYSRQDSATAREFVRELSLTGRTPGFYSGPRNEHLLTAPALLVLLSPGYLASDFSMRQLNTFVHRQKRFGMSGFIVPVILTQCDVPESLRDIQTVNLKEFRRRKGGYEASLQAVANALDRIIHGERQLPPLPDLDVAGLVSIAESRGYRELLRELYSRPDLSELYWTLLTSMRGENESWEEWFGRSQNTRTPDAGLSAEPEWHEAMGTVAASLNDHARLEDDARHSHRLLNLLKQNRGGWLISRVGRYYAFLIEPSMDAAEDLIDAVKPDSEELRFARAWLPWLRGVSWIAARMVQLDLIQRVQQKIDSLQLAVPGRMDPKAEFAIACQDEIHGRIRPWVALAQLANDYVETRGLMKPGDDRTVAMTGIAQRMRSLADAPDRADLERLLPDRRPGRRLIAYAVLRAQPDSAVRAPLIAAVIAESQPFLQYWGLEALRAIVAKDPQIDTDEHTALEVLLRSLSQSSDRAAVLRDILGIPKRPPDQVAKIIAAQRENALGELPYLPQEFLGRSRDLLQGERMLADAKYLVVRGAGGEGKTTFAAELARRLVATEKFDRAAFTSVEKLTEARQVLFSIGDQLIPQYARQAGTDDARGLQLVERALGEHRTVVVIDSVESVLATGSDDILGLCEKLTGIGETRVVFTTREPLPAPFESNELRIGRLDRDTAIRLLINLLPNAPKSDGTEEDLGNLVDAVGGHARSLVLIAREVGAAGVRHATENLVPVLRAIEAKNPGSRENSLLANTELSLRRLPPEIRQAIRPLSMFQGGGGIPAIGVALKLNQEQLNAIVRALIDVGLAEYVEPQYLRLDPALPGVDLAADERETARAAWADAMAAEVRSLYQQRAKNPNLANNLTLLELPNFLAALTHLARARSPESVIDLATSLESMVATLNRPKALARIVEIRTPAAKNLRGWSHAQFEAEHASIDRLIDERRFNEAVQAALALNSRCEAAGEAAYSGAAYDGAMGQFTLGRTLQMSGDAEAAIPHLDLARDRFDRLKRPRMVGLALNNKAACLADLGRYEDAAKAYQETIKIAEQVNDPRTAAVGRGQLGWIRSLQKDYAEALRLYAEARDAFKRIGEPTMVGVAWRQIGGVYRQVGQFDSAEQAYQESLDTAVQLGDHASQGNTLTSLGNLYADMGRREEAVRLYRHAAEIQAQLGDLLAEGRSRNNLAGELIKLNRVDEARGEIERAIECGKPLGRVSEPWKTFDILSDLERAVGNQPAALEARTRALTAYLAYRRDGGAPQIDTTQLIDFVKQNPDRARAALDDPEINYAAAAEITVALET